MKFDGLFPIIGEFGRYQKRIYILLFLPAISCGMHKLAWVFLAPRIEHRCQLPIEGPNATYSQLPWGISINMTFPPNPMPFKSPRSEWDSCRRLDVNYSSPHYFLEGIPTQQTIPCGGKYVYDYSTYQSSARIDYDMHCDRSFYYTNAQNLFMVGNMIGSILFGSLSDRIGRRPVFFLSLILQVVFALLAGFAPEYWSFVLARLVVGASTSGVFLVGYVIAMEMVGPSKRTFVGVCAHMFFTVGYMSIPAFAYFIKDWHILQIALSLPGLIFLSYYWFLPESVRWLLAKGRNQEAKAILKKVALENQVEISEEVYEELLHDTTSQELEQPKASSISIFEIFRYKRLVLLSLTIFFCWFVNSGVYYGLSLSTSSLGGNDYVNFTLAGAVEIPAFLFLLVSLQKFGRKVVLSGCMLAGGAFMTACALIPDGDEWNWLLVTFAMIGKMCITASYNVIYIFTAESFPTVVRNGGVGASSMFARVGGVTANSLLILGEYWKPLPILLFGAMTLVAGFLALLIPETFGKQLPETLEDWDKFGRNKNINEELELNGKDTKNSSKQAITLT